MGKGIGKRLSVEELEQGLARYSNGTDSLFEHWLGRFNYSDGVKFLADEAGAHWLIDAIASHQPEAMTDRMCREFQLWLLTVRGDGSARLACCRDTDDIMLEQYIPWTDFPLSEIKLYLENGVLMLPSER